MPVADTVAMLRTEAEHVRQGTRLAVLRELLAAGCPHGCIPSKAKPCPFVRELEQRIAGLMTKKSA